MTTQRDDWKTEQVDDLCDALLALRTADEMASFLRDLCTHNEISELSSRWAIVLHLSESMPYREIAKTVDTSTATVTRVNQWLRRGAGGYQLALKRLQEES